MDVIVNAPPLEPVTLAPTFPATPLTSATVSVSPSGSVSLLITLPVVVDPAATVPVSATAVGAGLMTFQTNVCDVVTPDGSVAVMTTVYGPETLADGSIVPVMTPVFGSMLKPGGRVPPSPKLSTSLPSGSLKLPLTSSVTLPASLPL